jgi:hypothetical protein
MHRAVHPKLGILDPGPTRVNRTVVVVAAMHGAGMSRLARRFRQNTVARFDRVASAWCGQAAYNRGYAGELSTAESSERCARVVAARLASGHRPGLRVLLTHEHPDLLVKALQYAGIRSHWYLYSPDETERMRRIAARKLAPGVLRYMTETWRSLYKLRGCSDEFRVEEEVIQCARAIVAS